MNTASSSQEALTFNTGSTPVSPGSAYVFFISSSGLSGTGSGNVRMSNTDIPGVMVYLANGNDTGLWTTDAWGDYNVVDVAFTATFADGSPVPEPSTSALVLVGVVAGALRQVRRRRHS